MPALLDFTEVPYMDSAGLGAVLGAYASRQKTSRSLALAGVSERVKNVFEITRVESFFKFFPTVAAAEQGMSKAS